MCGIVGYVGPREAAPILLQGLARLEYRGYDSAGLAVLNGHGLETRKLAGRVAVLGDAVAREPLAGACGIAHTRWATAPGRSPSCTTALSRTPTCSARTSRARAIGWSPRPIRRPWCT